MSIDIIVAGSTHSLTDGVTSYLIGKSGWGIAPLHRISERGPQQHGVTDAGFRHDARIANLKLGVSATSMANLQTLVDNLGAWHKPRNTPFALRWTLDDGAIRQIDAFYLDGLNAESAGGLGFHREYTISYQCPDPFFYDPVSAVESFGIAAGADAWEIPWVIGWTIGGSTLDHTKDVIYPGTAPAYPVIRIYGPVTQPVVENQTTGEQIAFKDSVTIADGDYYEIDLRYGYKTVVDASDANKLGDLDPTVDNDLATFHLEPDPDADGGVNVFHVTGTSAAANTQVRLTYNARYLGIY